MSEDLDKILNELSQTQAEYEKKYDEECESFWNGLSQDDKLMAFYSVVKRVHENDVKVRGTYRYGLYHIFGFGPVSYGIGMMCGYMDIHNLIFDGMEKNKDSSEFDFTGS